MTAPFVSVVNLGCRVNRVESDRISADLARAGFCLVDPEDAQLVVINTCAVTGEAEAKTRKAVRHTLSLPCEPLVIVTGCVVNLHPDELTDISPRVTAEPSKVAVVDRARELLSYDTRLLGRSSNALAPLDLADMLGRSRLGVKIQDGCNHRCTYCIVWKARGPERSVPVSAVLEQIEEAVQADIPEVVLTGVNLGAYDAEGPGDAHVEIDELLDRIMCETTVQQVRLSSIEPMDVTEALLERMARSRDRVAPFLHLPIQSGCSETLRRMGRPYSSEDLLALIDKIRLHVPDIALSGDLIVGFPGETDEEFEKTLKVVKSIGFARLHVFRYSARPGTPAATYPDQIDPQVAAARSARVRALVQQSALEDAARRVSTLERAVLEYGNRGTLGSFHRVIVDDADASLEGSLVHVRIDSLDDSGMLHAHMV